MTITTLAEAFQGLPIDVFVLGNERWVKAVHIGAALGFANPAKGVEQILHRNRTLFDASTTVLIELPTPGGAQLTRLYNARGAALVAVKARTPKGDDFRLWVLDVLEGRDDSTPVEVGAMPDGVRHSLATMFMQRRGNPQLLRYRQMGLGTAEIARLLNVKPASVNPRLRVAEFLGLTAPPPGLAELRQRPTFIKLQEGRDRRFAAIRAAKALAAPTAPEAGENGNG